MSVNVLNVTWQLYADMSSSDWNAKFCEKIPTDCLHNNKNINGISFCCTLYTVLDLIW